MDPHFTTLKILSHFCERGRNSIEISLDYSVEKIKNIYGTIGNSDTVVFKPGAPILLALLYLLMGFTIIGWYLQILARTYLALEKKENV